jgi:Fic family protein
MDGLLDVSKTGNYDDWVAFFSQAVHDQALEGLQTIRSLLDLKESMVSELRNAGARGSAIEIAENLIGYPIIDVPTVKAMIGRSFETANKAVARLVEQGILAEITGRQMNRLFACERVLQVIRA